MSQLTTEMFGHFVYPRDLGCTDLMRLEETVRERLEDVLAQAGGEALNFEPKSDSLQVQCLFPSYYGENSFHDICDALIQLMDGTVEGRLLFVSKNLEHLHFYTLSCSEWKEACINLPMAGPLGEALRQEQLRKPT